MTTPLNVKRSPIPFVISWSVYSLPFPFTMHTWFISFICLALCNFSFQPPFFPPPFTFALYGILWSLVKTFIGFYSSLFSLAFQAFISFYCAFDSFLIFFFFFWFSICHFSSTHSNWTLLIIAMAVYYYEFIRSLHPDYENSMYVQNRFDRYIWMLFYFLSPYQSYSSIHICTKHAFQFTHSM